MYKKARILFLFSLLMTVCAGNLHAKTPVRAQGKTAIVYFSQTGNTRTVCEVVAKELTADLFEIKVAEPAAEKGQLPKIEPERIDLTPYSSVVVASPIWAANLVPAIRAFLKNNPLGNRKVFVLTTTNAPMPENFQKKHTQLLSDAGGTIAGYHQLVMMEQKEGTAAPRAQVEIQKETATLADKIKTAIGR